MHCRLGQNTNQEELRDLMTYLLSEGPARPLPVPCNRKRFAIGPFLRSKRESPEFLPSANR
jgi:hypothetical protein